MTVLLKMHAWDKIFEKKCLKATILFFPICAVIRGQGDSIFWLGLYQTEEESSNFFGLQGDPQIPSLSGTIFSGILPIRKTMRRVLDLLILKVASATFLLVCFLSLNKRTCRTRKNIFYFTSKSLLVLQKIKF